MDLNKLLAAVVGLHRDVVRLRADLERAEVIAPNYVGRGTKRRGRIENHVIDFAVSGEPAKGPHLSLEQFIAACSEAIPQPEPGKRDVRRQVVTRAVQTLLRERGGPIMLYKSLDGLRICASSADLDVVGMDANGDELFAPAGTTAVGLI